jgi:hypothetical protein
LADGAVSLLPHLIETMDWAASIIIVRNRWAELEYAAAEVANILDAGVHDVKWKSGGAGEQVVVVFAKQIRLRQFGDLKSLEGRGGSVAGNGGGKLSARRRDIRIRLLSRWTDGKGGLVERTVLCR